ncbi:FAD/NAD-P-binding domain-containing protein [Irpex rosettiformis]|uniref:FAD/NAD-P-binding domain-containing protein n=1 Tax=Irpex rosettiformis TaxID=378272 RepID=A0ACB8U8X9_9APHY|nr:FAD/NAD-P-binding domain-containing protein [Irpex rosettiformis]
MSSSGSATLSIDFIIVGGGISGLSTAYTLCKAGHKVKVFEKMQGVGFPSSGIRVPPNMSKILKKWVGEEELYKTAVLNVATPCIDSEYALPLGCVRLCILLWRTNYVPCYTVNSGNRIGVIPWKPVVMAETGGDYLLMKHEDAYSIVHRLAISAGARIVSGVTVINVVPGSPKPSVILSTGETIYADVIIGADGWNSIVRQVVCGAEGENDHLPKGPAVYAGTVTAEQLKGDPALEHLMSSNEFVIGFGTGMAMCIFPVRANSELSVFLYLPDQYANTLPNNSGEPSDCWYNIVPASSIKVDGLAPCLVQRLVPKMCSVSRLRWRQPKQAKDWVDRSGRIALLGEAAHPFPTGTTYATAACLEDAVVLGTLFSQLSSPQQISTVLHAFHEIRETRCRNLVNTEITNATLTMLPPGPERDARDKALASANVGWDDESAARIEYDRLAEMFGYEAEDAAMQWWVDWGRYTQDELFAEPITPNTTLSVEKFSLDV